MPTRKVSANVMVQEREEAEKEKRGLIKEPCQDREEKSWISQTEALGESKIRNEMQAT